MTSESSKARTLGTCTGVLIDTLSMDTTLLTQPVTVTAAAVEAFAGLTSIKASPLSFVNAELTMIKSVAEVLENLTTALAMGLPSAAR